jgi:predicted GNAT family acetyltransferase
MNRTLTIASPIFRPDPLPSLISDGFREGCYPSRMLRMEIVRYDSPCEAREHAQKYLALDTLRNTLVLTILDARIADAQPGRYWVAVENGQVVGVGLQAPLERPLVLSVMPLDTAAKLAIGIAKESVELAGVTGEAQNASRFAGEWTACRRVAAHPIGARRLYELRSVRPGATTKGAMERAAPVHQEIVHDWHAAFLKDIGESSQDADFVRRRIEAGLVWFWTDEGFKSIATVSPPVLSSVRFQSVYTPPDYRRRGYAESLVRAVSRQLLGEGLRTMLITDLGDPVANGVYQRIGYEAAAEMILYRFLPATR